MFWIHHRSTNRGVELRTDPTRVAAYFADRTLMWRNVILVMLGNLGYGIAFSVIGPLMLLRMKECGISERWIGAVIGGNLWLVSFLVMYFSWQSDHLISRFGRRVPYLLISAPPVILAVILFPFFTNPAILLGLWIVMLIAGDMKASTWSLIIIDCVPRKELARLSALSSLVPGVCSFLALRYGMRLTHGHEALPYIVGAPIIIVATLIAAFGVKEPPIYTPATGRFKPWSTMAVAWRDKRVIWLMLGVGMIGAFLSVYGNFIWLFAKARLGLERTEIADALSWSPLIGVAMAYPTGWVVDKLGGRRVVVVYWILVTAMYVALIHVTNSSGLLAVAILQCCTSPLYAGADMMVYKSAPPEHVGSITSTNSFLRNLIGGCVALGAGQIIGLWGYPAAFTMGIAVSSLGLLMFFIHQRMMDSDPEQACSRGPR